MRLLALSALREKCPYLDFSGPNAGKYGPEEL